MVKGCKAVPTRTIVQDLCDVCFAEQDELEVPATDRLRFAWQGRDLVLLVCEKHADPIRNELERLSELASPDGNRRRATSSPRAARPPASAEPGGKTLFSQLSEDDKQRFRAWADMPNARRIGDSRVLAWTEAGRP
jgi:hypothetical protein